MDGKIQAKAAEIKHTGTASVLVPYLQELLKTKQTEMTNIKELDLLRQWQGRAQQLTELIKFFSSEK